MAQINSCNVFDPQKNSEKLWRFSANGGQIRQQGVHALTEGDAMPVKLVTKGWSSIWQKSVNIAWLPEDKVFLSIAKIPPCDSAEEMRTMVEFQLEKISPLPVGHIIWSLEKVPATSGIPDAMQTVIVVIASRNAVERHLGQMEEQGYQPDRLEVPFLHQLLSTPVEDNGVWIYPFTFGKKSFCITAWWYHKTLCSLSLIHFSNDDKQAEELAAELNNVAWAGEMEGWITTEPKIHLVADEDAAPIWHPIIEKATDTLATVIKPLPLGELAALNAQRVATGESLTNLLPDEFATRYQQQLTDRIWMRGLGAVVMVYIACVMAYFGWLHYLNFQQSQLTSKIAAVEPSYNETLEIEARIAIQEQQESLRFASLDCWKAVAEVLPTGLTLDSFTFSRGESIALVGSAPAGQITLITDYNEALANYTVNGERLFSQVDPPSSQQSVRQGVLQWRFSCQLANAETQ